MPEKQSSRSLTALNWLNFFAADISTGVGPFLAVYLATNLHYKPGQIGMAIAATNFSMVLFQAPAGYFIDKTSYKRGAIIAASSVMGITAASIPFFHNFPFIIGSQILMGAAGSFYVPTLIALASVLAAKGKFDKTISKNQSYNHAGNVAAAILIGVVARLTNNEGIFYCLLLLSVMCTVSTLSISQHDLNKPKEQQSDVKDNEKTSIRDMLRNKAFIVFLLLTVVFYFSNGAMLPLVAQELAKGKEQDSTLYLSACIIIAQLVMVPTAYFCGKKAGSGRKKLLIVAFILLAARGILYTFTAKSGFLLSFQILDGMAAGIFSVVSIMVVADLMGKSGKASFAQGLLATSLSLGSTLSNLIAGFIVDGAGFRIGFVFLSALALAALFLLWKAMPETLQKAEQQAEG
jgi:MFS family permease